MKVSIKRKFSSSQESKSACMKAVHPVVDLEIRRMVAGLVFILSLAHVQNARQGAK
jgi:hypothetical protein